MILSALDKVLTSRISRVKGTTSTHYVLLIDVRTVKFFVRVVSLYSTGKISHQHKANICIHPTVFF